MVGLLKSQRSSTSATLAVQVIITGQATWAYGNGTE